MVDTEFKYYEFPMWFFTYTEGRDTIKVSIEKKDWTVKSPVLYSREFTEEKANMNFLQFKPTLLRACAY